MIIAKNLTVKIGNKIILDGVSFEVKKGEFVAIIGPNGAGKTTLIKTLLGLIRPTRGDVKISGLLPDEYIKLKNGIGYLPQKAIVNWSMPLRVLDVVLIERLKPFGLFRGYTKKDIEAAMHWLSRFGVEDKAFSYIRDLSGGQQQRVSLARCMINSPEILVLDEPNTAIDAVYNSMIYEILRDLSSQNNITIIMVTHDIGAVSAYVDEVMCLNVKLHCHGKPSTIDYSHMLKTVYGDGMNIMLHSEACKNCKWGGNG
ncbi:metal ABC transporter ATP-binding protein [Hippea maritima]|uniref:Phosphonate-transporting ATPase n=1 Tax=Hippea maritima (strain ATCC 700847 / DSM 10411 / MH2) TaxID=760142 RepID=F2LW71_HIPMA|nr:metal ABC transporter ATP-binding protein [Hippea maritima]AEA34005.1 Phosphonate-transporting ATPase [Hippea maritima DSM 10411]